MSDYSRADDEAIRIDALFKVAIARGGTRATDEQLKVYLERLEHYTAIEIQQACAVLADKPRKDFEPLFPPVGDIIETIRSLRKHAEIENEWRRIQSHDHDAEPTFVCHVCRDAKWEVRRCPDQTCGKNQPHRQHDWVRRCACWLRKNAESLRVSNQDRIAKGLDESPDFRALQDLMSGHY